MNFFSLSCFGPLAVRILVPVASLLAGEMAHAQLFSGTAFPNASIPDNSAVGLVSEQTVSGFTGGIAQVTVQLSFSSVGSDPMFNGDLYVALTYNSVQTVLINRVGRRTGSSLGYGDSGFDITLSDSAPADVHNYRLTLNGSHSVPLSPTETPAALTGSWQPDGREVDPLLVTSDSPRTATLSVFNGQDGNGNWTLFVADFSPSGLAKLDFWTLEISPVPEPLETGLAAGLLLVVGFGYRKLRSHRETR